MKITRCFKVRIYPTPEQVKLFSKTFGCRRFVYNKYVEQREIFYNENIKNKNLSDKEKNVIYNLFKYKTEKQLKEEFPYQPPTEKNDNKEFVVFDGKMVLKNTELKFDPYYNNMDVVLCLTFEN